MPKDLRYFLNYVAERAPDEIVRVRRPVKAEYEISAVMRSLEAQHRNPVIYFDQVDGSTMPVVANLYASPKLVALAFETDLDGAILKFIDAEERLIKPRRFASGPVKDVILVGEEADLGRLPIVTHCERDGGPFICPGVMVVRDPDTGICNAGMYRHMLEGPRQLGALFGEQQHCAHILRKYEARGQDMPAAIVLGHHPAVGLGSQFNGALEVDEYEIMGALLDEPLDLVPCETVDLEVPSHTEVVIEGYVEAGVRQTDGPFGEYTFYYGETRRANVFHVTAVTHRHDAIFHDLYNAGVEHNYCATVGIQAKAYRHIKAVVPQLQRVHMPHCGVLFLIYVQIKKEYEGLGKTAALAALGASPYIQWAIVVDDDVDIYNDQEVIWAAITRTVPNESFFYVPGVAVSALDPLAHAWGDRKAPGMLQTKLGIDATKPLGFPFPDRAEPPRALWKNIRLEDYLEAWTAPPVGTHV